MSLTIGPPIDPEDLVQRVRNIHRAHRASVDGVTQLATEGGQKFLGRERFRLPVPPGRPRNNASPCSSFVPDFVTMFSAGPAVQPNSDENAFDSAVIS